MALSRATNKPTQHFHRAYFFRPTEQDPIIDTVRTLMETTGFEAKDIHEKGGPAVSTINNWMDGKTRRPQFCTVAAAGRSMGYTLGWHQTKHQMNGKNWTAKPLPILQRVLREG
jgi:hypothetical protein